MKYFNDLLGKLYGVMMTASFFGGFLPIIPFVIALIIGGNMGESIALFLYNGYYPWIIGIGSVAVLVGLIHGYVEDIVNKQEKKEA